MFVKILFLLLFVVEMAFSDFYYNRQSGRRTAFIDCPTPTLANGRIRTRQRSHVAKFQCNTNYELVGNKYATCTMGQWDEPPPVCVRPSESCIVPDLSNGVVLPQRRGAWVTFFCIPGYELRGVASIYCDGRGWNAAFPSCVATSSGEKSLSCDFESPDLCGWRQDELHDFDWRRLNKKTPSSFLNTGPKFDHTLGYGKEGYYMYIESTARPTNSTARLLSPLYDSSVAKNGCFQFYYHMFGLSTGGLRVYQKPDSKPQDEVFRSDPHSKYILFELWHNQGDFWHRAVVPLNDFKEDFQLVIEGIRGVSFTSDIAIDDVAILQGDNCTKAFQAVSVPTSTVPPVDSCVGRCVSPGGQEEPGPGCGCSITCLVEAACCPDYLDVCEFNKDTADTSPDDDDANAPQKEPLVAPTSEATTTSTTTTTVATTSTSTTKPTLTTTSTTTQKPITTTPSKTTVKIIPTTIKTTTKAATRIIPKIIFLTTEKIHNATEDKVTNSTTAKIKITTTRKPVTTAKKAEATTVKTKTVSTTVNQAVTLGDLPVFSSARSNLENTKTIAEKSNGKSSAVVTTLLVLSGLVILAAAVWLVMLSRSSRGRSMMDRLRGRVYHDPEVRYLTRDED